MFSMRRGVLCLGLLCALAAPGALSQEIEEEVEGFQLRQDRPWTHLVVRLKGGKVVTFSREEIESVGTRSPSPHGRPGQAAPIAGTWSWVKGQTLVIDPDRTFDVYEGSRQVNEGEWESLGGARFKLTHRRGGFVDTVVLSSDQDSLDGQNRSGDRLHGTRQFGYAKHLPWGQRLVGTWDWMSGQTLRVFEAGTFELFEGDRKVNEGRWESLGRTRYRLVHRNGGYVDTVSLAEDGRSLSGFNNNGLSLRGMRR